MTFRLRARLGHLTFIGLMSLCALYFVYEAIHGDFGVFRRAELEAETLEFRIELATLAEQVAHMENLTRRMSDDYLEMDLLDQQARDVLGLVRPDEVIVR